MVAFLTSDHALSGKDEQNQSGQILSVKYVYEMEILLGTSVKKWI